MSLIRYAITAAMLCVQPAFAADETPTETPAQALVRLMEANRRPIAIERGLLVGAGAANIVDASRHAQFILVGEDHGFVEVPQFVLALRATLGADAPANLALETGPLAAAQLADAARTNTMAELSARYPAAIPFFDWKDDGAMAWAFQKGQREDVLWGLDQEFILSTRMNLERLLQLNPESREVAGYAKRASAAEAKMLADHDPSAVLLPQLQEEDFAQLRAALKVQDGSVPAAIIDELAESADIYRAQGSDGDASNHQRALLMKRHFMAYYNAAAQRQTTPVRAMARLGAYHAGRGLNPINQYDIGNLASELAESRGLSSVHILLIAASGTVNKWLPFMPDQKARAMTYDAKGELDSVHAVPFLAHALPNHWSVFDLQAFRSERTAIHAGGPGFAQLVFAYDYVIVVPVGHAATEYDD